MIMNYNKWVFNQHNYLSGIRNDKESFNDTKWVDMNKRYKTLLNLQSELLDKQPFGVVSNNVGFEKLIDLMSKSNYTFEDINDSLIDTYKVSLQNAMSRNLVNTHAVMFHCTNMDKMNVSSDKFTHYYIIDASFNQLHFGDRDEFIRQKLQEMYSTGWDNYVDIGTFISSEFSKLLGFSIICTVNGYFCNDCKIAISDKGFKFKIGWPYSSDIDFIVYKLDEACVYSFDIDIDRLKAILNDNNKIYYRYIGNIGIVNGLKCILNIHDKNYNKSVSTVPNFGLFDENGLNLINIQSKTIDDLNQLNTKNVTIDVYALKYFHEIPNVYPAINYMDMMDQRKVLTERCEDVYANGKLVVGSSEESNWNDLEICTPPIAIDRNVNYSFSVISNCLGMYKTLMKYENALLNIGSHIKNPNYTDKEFFYKDQNELKDIHKGLATQFIYLQKMAIITSLISSRQLDLIESLMNKIKSLITLTDYSQIQKYTFDELYGVNYKYLVKDITSSFNNDKLKNFINLNEINVNYFNDNGNSTRFNRPVGEQNFIVLKYHRDIESWLFDYEEIKHFHGIGNTFYIDTDLKGNEIFKFFVLYSDTEGINHENIDKFTFDQIIDFDTFSNEVSKHLGCIRYWYAENKLAKISKLMFNSYDDDTCVQILSKILKRKIEGDDLINIYPSDINYEPSNISSDNWKSYNEDTERSPFAVNFLFYTLSMLNGNEDKLQSYFYDSLTRKKYNNRYSDIDISSVLSDHREKINYSNINSVTPTINTDKSNIPNESSAAYIFYGIPNLVNSNGIYVDNNYSHTLNVYDTESKHYLIQDGMINEEYYVILNTLDDSLKYDTFKNDIRLCQLVTLYLKDMYDYISAIQTNYQISYNQLSLIESAMDTTNTHIDNINKFNTDKLYHAKTGDVDANDVIDLITNENKFNMSLLKMKYLINSINVLSTDNRNISFVSMINELISSLRFIYTMYGFDNYALKRARKLYIHLKKINTKMNLYEYKKWLNNIDVTFLKLLDKMYADNKYNTITNKPFEYYGNLIQEYITSANRNIDLLENVLNDKNSEEYIELKSSHIDPLVEYCKTVISNYIFDLYIINDIVLNESISVSNKPLYATISLDNSYKTNSIVSISSNDPVFGLSYDTINSSYKINGIIKNVQHVFFKGDDANNVTIKIYDINRNLIKSSTCDITFIKISSTADVVNDIDELINFDNTNIEFENIHESYEIDTKKLIVNRKHTDMNYEMLIGNRFTQLTHERELVLKPNTYVQGSIDQLYISNQEINNMVMNEFGHKNCFNMYFKPSQIFHLDFNDDVNSNSIYNRLFEGEHIYLATEDGLYAFPVIVTAIDHSVNKGFIEVKVDNWNSKWFKINDINIAIEYLTNNIKCHVIEDNMMNFLDEYNNGDYYTYYNTLWNHNNDNDDISVYTLPGDPLYVSNNTDFVYSRINWIFNGIVPNNEIDEESKRHKFIYITNGFINDENDSIRINMINFNNNRLTNPEKYPILRHEPNDHGVWDAEIKKFKEEQNNAYQLEQSVNRERKQAEYAIENSKTKYEREIYIAKLEECDMDIKKYQERRKRLELMIRQLETPTTWYNVRSYEASLVYIANGRADKFSPTFIDNISDLVYTDKLNVYLYDWEHKQWLSPDTYEIDIEYVDNIALDNHDDYVSNKVLYSINITPKEDFIYSKKILIYFSYNKSDIFDELKINNESTCDVRFKPFLNLDNEIDNFDPYANIRIRKHFDGYERYLIEGGYNTPDDFDNEDAFYIKRIDRSGKYVYSPTMRLCDINVDIDGVKYDYTNFEMYVKYPFINHEFNNDDKMIMFKHHVFNAIIIQPIDYFVENTNVKLICISNNDKSDYDGNISSVMFEGILSYDNDNQIVTITKTTLPTYKTGTFICTVFQDDSYHPCGGIIQIQVTNTDENVINNQWVRITDEMSVYREIPREFILKPKTNISLNNNSKVYITIQDTYESTSNDVIKSNNSNINNPFEYYHNTKEKTKLPISDTRINSHNQRLVIDTTINPDIKLIKSPYIGICRYSLQKINKDGLIDMTGYLPTPLSRDRYEFWVNGRCIINQNDIIITSPTTIQLCNLKSLRNFECIELVDDMYLSEILPEGNVYSDLYGNIYGSYQLAMLSNKNIRNQNIQFMFNASNCTNLQSYTKTIIDDPNNDDLEEDILSSIQFNDTDNKNYNYLYNIPSINGTRLHHPKIDSLGVMEVPNDEIIKLMDKVWKYEIMTNPLFNMTHKDNIEYDEKKGLKLHIKKDNESNNFIIYAIGNTEKYFSLYISNISNGNIDDINNTLKIIPFVQTGTLIVIDDTYIGKWIHSTIDNTKPIQIKNL